MLITLTTVSWPLGAVVGGAISAKLIPAYGWQSVFYWAALFRSRLSCCWLRVFLNRYAS